MNTHSTYAAEILVRLAEAERPLTLDDLECAGSYSDAGITQVMLKLLETGYVIRSGPYYWLGASGSDVSLYDLLVLFDPAYNYTGDPVISSVICDALSGIGVRDLVRLDKPQPPTPRAFDMLHECIGMIGRRTGEKWPETSHPDQKVDEREPVV
ncbi:hypothetical protein [uncultured Alistipes sp.]|jgi:hypothetical protein|uniref:hypothetical protein n=1 Tax=uncultured Alistipes sp. TaxID=538949 RepID=UPI0025DAAB4E|nr:hypothetical protein [uncultured Alistipes sp.]